MTQEMLELAHADLWDEVTSLERERQSLLSNCFAQPIPDAQSGLFSEALAAMLAINEEIIGLLEVAKQNVAIKEKVISGTLNAHWVIIWMWKKAIEPIDFFKWVLKCVLATLHPTL